MLFLDENDFCEAERETEGFELDIDPFFAVETFGEMDEQPFDWFCEDDESAAAPSTELDPGEERAERERTLYGTGVEAMRLRAVNKKSAELVSYKRTVESFAGRLRKPRLQKLADLFREQYNVSIGRDGRRGVWSLWAFFRTQFPNPLDFVDFIE